MKVFFGLLILLISCISFALPGISMTLKNGQNFPFYMIVGGPSASITYDILNTTGGGIYHL